MLLLVKILYGRAKNYPSPNLPDVPFVVMKLERISQDVSIAHGSLDKRSSFTRRGSTALKASSSPG